MLLRCSFLAGRIETTRVHTERLSPSIIPGSIGCFWSSTNEDLSVSCAAYLCWTLYFLGFPDHAHGLDQMLKQARKFEHPHTLRWHSALHPCCIAAGQPAANLTLSAETVEVSRNITSPSGWLRVK